MKRLKQVLEADLNVIQFNSKTVKPPSTTITKEDANSQLNTIVNNRKNAWSHSAILSRDNDHSLHNLAHFVGNTYQNLYGNTGNHAAIGEFNRSKKLAQQAVIDNKKDIHAHLSDTIANLERLATNVQNSKFTDMPTIVKVHTTLHRWKKTRDLLHSVE